MSHQYCPRMRKRISDERIELHAAIRAMHGCESRYVRSVPVREVFNDLVAWEGSVEVFDLIDHPKAKRCYAWSFQDGNQARSVTVLELPPVDSPDTAVKVAIAAKARERALIRSRKGVT